MRRTLLVSICLLLPAVASASPILASTLTGCEARAPGFRENCGGAVPDDIRGVPFIVSSDSLVDEFDVFGIDAGVGFVAALSNPRVIGGVDPTMQWDVAGLGSLGPVTITSQRFGSFADGTSFFEYFITLQTPMFLPRSADPYMVFLTGVNEGGGGIDGNPVGLLVDGRTATRSQCCGAGVVVHGTEVPEPSTCLLIATGLAALRRRLRREPPC